MSRKGEKKLFFDLAQGTHPRPKHEPRLIDPHTEQPMLRAPVVYDLEALARENAARLAHEREVERQRVAKAAEVVPQRYSLMPGRVLIRARPIEKTWDAAGMIEMDSNRQEMMRAHEPWGTILMVGKSFYTDHGQLMEPDPEWVAGRQVMFNPAGATDLELPMPGTDGEEKMALLLVGFRGILLVDRGENSSTPSDTRHRT